MNKMDREERAADLVVKLDMILIEHPLLVEFESRINALVRIGERSPGREKQCMPLIAPSGCGKSTLIRNSVGKLNANRKTGEFPALYVPLKPVIGKKSLVQDILTELARVSERDTCPDNGNEGVLLERANNYLTDVRCKVLFIDEFQHVLLSETEKQARAVGEKVKWFLNEGPCTIVVAGTEEAWGPFRANPQLLRRAARSVDLRPLSLNSKEDRDVYGRFFAEYFRSMEWDPLESTCRHASLSIL